MAGSPAAQIAQADKLVSSASGGFSFFGGKANKLEDAARLYKSAGDNLFSICKQHPLWPGTHCANKCVQTTKAHIKRLHRYTRRHATTSILCSKLASDPSWPSLPISCPSADTPPQAATLYRDSLKETIEWADCIDKASKAYRKTSPSDAARTLTALINFRKSEGEFRRATKPQQELAELYENELQDTAKAIEAYETAGRWFENDRAESLANKCYLKVADLAALNEDYSKAIEKFEGVAKNCVGNNLMRFSVKEYLLKAGICHLAKADMVGMNRALEGYREMDPSFAQQRECQLLVDLTTAVEANDGELFSEKLFQYDQMSKLDQWKTGEYPLCSERELG